MQSWTDFLDTLIYHDWLSKASTCNRYEDNILFVALYLSISIYMYIRIGKQKIKVSHLCVFYLGSTSFRCFFSSKC